ncbi:beta-sandwich domain-containing protein [Bdellovibrio sp. HCB2-146]|uniref:beta-sandwich domain-containing protein n=1 Tax=Bdellovibrio sp. HCB2-146 TaxID=3394362 RepID=UPI0039BD20AC
MFTKLCRVFLCLALAAPVVHAAPGQLPKPPAPPSQPNPPPKDPQYEGVGRIDQVSRQGGGEIYRLDLVKAIPLVRLEAKSKMGRLKIYSTALVTDKNERIPVRQLAGVTLDDSMQPLSSEIFNVQAGIAAIEILAEAFGGEASLEIKAFSTKEAPKLSQGTRPPEYSCKRNIDALLKDKLEPVQLWVARAEASAPGSVQEKFAGNQLKEQVKDFVATLKTTGSYSSTPYLLTLINFFMDQYNSVRAGGVSEPAYKDLLNSTFSVLLFAVQNELPCRRFPSDALIKMSMDLNKKYLEMSESARARPILLNIMTKIRDFAPEQYRKEVTATNPTFREADTEGTKYYIMFTKAKDEDFLKTTHRNMSAYAFVVAEQALQREVKMMDIEQRYQLIVEYQAKYNSNTDFPQAVAARYLQILADSTYGSQWMKMFTE